MSGIYSALRLKKIFILTMNYRGKTGISLENVQYIHKKNLQEKKIGDSRRITGFRQPLAKLLSILDEDSLATIVLTLFKEKLERTQV